MDIEPTDIPGCFLFQTRPLTDPRGSFVKTFHGPRYMELGLRDDWQEEFFSVSAAGVVRGLHFQLPPAGHAKMVFCLTGAVLDVVVDLRRGSPAYGRPLKFNLSAENGRGLYLPTGCAHGFASLTDHSGMYYKVTSVHSPEHDAGIAWDSVGLNWGVEAPQLSDRDRSHPALAQFNSPFVFNSEGVAH